MKRRTRQSLAYEEEEEDDHIRISEKENSEFMEFPKEEDSTILLSTIQAQFPHAIGLKYKASSGAWRAIRAVDNILEAPKGGWGDQVYCLTTSDAMKRKNNDLVDDRGSETKVSRNNTLLNDMAVIGLPYETTIEELREYFESNYGELVYSEIKFDRDTGKSRGFGFIRFKDEAVAKAAVSADHFMMGRKVEVRQKKDKPMKMFIGRLPHGTTMQELDTHFSQYGQLTDTYIPTPFRNFAFITYASSEDAKSCMRETHIIGGARLNVMERNTYKDKPSSNDNEERNSNTSNGGYSTKYNPRDDQQHSRSTSHNNDDKSQRNMDPDLKSLIFQFLSRS